ncbi:hypothetical protein ABT247_04930 [Kitasatospora sp. NPDC001539]|uniref:hypothetical protein n=1 Tax=Kitasatospora sp. NPDC001539 TaxID=3154384 RepID=UPI003327C003
MSRRPRAALAALFLAGAALLTAACGPTGHPGPGAADANQVQDMQHKLDAADNAADRAATDAAADGN